MCQDLPQLKYLHLLQYWSVSAKIIEGILWIPIIQGHPVTRMDQDQDCQQDQLIVEDKAMFQDQDTMEL